ncbi:hypothetical protein ACI65C_013622 [Semiaphis heraclei]
MSREGEKCNFCNRLRNDLNKVNWNRHLAKCELSFSTKITKPNKKSKNDRCGDIKSFFSYKRPKTENPDYDKQIQIPSVSEILPTDTPTAESLIEAEEKVLTAQYTSDISDGSSKKQHKRKREIDSIKFIHETGHSNVIRTKKGKISTSGDTIHSKLKTKEYKSKALLTKVESSESDDNMSDISSNSADHDSDKDKEYIPKNKSNNLTYDNNSDEEIIIVNSTENNDSNIVENHIKKVDYLNTNKAFPLISCSSASVDNNATKQSKFQNIKDDEIIAIIGKWLTTAKARIENKKHTNDEINLQ